MRQFLICTLAFALAAPVVSQAAVFADDHSAVNVRLRDVDPNQPSGATVVLARLDTAATEACGASSFSLSEYRRVVRNSACHAASLERAVAALNAPLVTELYDRRVSAND